MAKKRIIKAYRIHPDTSKAINQYAKGRKINKSRALDEIVASAMIALLPKPQNT